MKIKALSKIIDIIPILRQSIIKNSELRSEQVLNGESDFGANAFKKLDGEGDIYAGFTREEGFIIFNLSEEENGLDIIETLENNSLQNYTSLTFKLYIYGNNSLEVARKIKTRLLSQEVLSQLLNKGVFINSLSSIRSTNEFINNFMWPRRDLDINLQIRLEYSKKDSYEDYANEEEGQNIEERINIEEKNNGD